jgi:hypothetical protein
MLADFCDSSLVSHYEEKLGEGKHGVKPVPVIPSEVKLMLLDK